MKFEKIKGIRFDERPRIGHRDDALELLAMLIEAESAGFVENIVLPLEALKDAIERGII